MTVAVGTKVTGKVVGIKNFGAFVDIGNGQSGLVHISQISNDYVKDVHDKLSIGDKVTAIVTDDKDGKIALSMKKAEPKPAYKPRHHDHENNGKFHNQHGSHGKFNSKPKQENFDDMLADFMKDSQSRLTTLKKNTDGKRGGRGGRRS